MTRKEQILNEAVDYSFVEENFIEYDDCGDVCDDRDFIQKAFEEGAKWADRTMIEKTCEWLRGNMPIPEDFVESCTNNSTWYIEDFINNYRKAMEE